MKQVFSLRLLSCCALLSLLIVSCQKTYNPGPQNSTDQTRTQLMDATNDVYTAGVLENEDFRDMRKETGKGAVPCRMVTYNPAEGVYPYEKTIDFGSGCTDTEGHMKSGKKIITYLVDPATASPGDEIMKVHYEDFYVDGIEITGEVKTYLAAWTPYTLRVVANKGLSDENGNSKAFYAEHWWALTSGGDTEDEEDDVYEVTGHAEGVQILNGATSMSWSSEVDPLHHVINPESCRHRTMGAEKIEIHLYTGGGAVFSEYLDFGDGTCDSDATLSINGGVSQHVTLPLRFFPLSL